MVHDARSFPTGQLLAIGGSCRRRGAEFQGLNQFAIIFHKLFVHRSVDDKLQGGLTTRGISDQIKDPRHLPFTVDTLGRHFVNEFPVIRGNDISFADCPKLVSQRAADIREKRLLREMFPGFCGGNRSQGTLRDEVAIFE